MASRVSEVLYRLRDFFTAPAKKIESGYARLRAQSRATADALSKDAKRQSAGLLGLEGGIGRLIGSWRALGAATGAVGAGASFKGLIDQADRIGKAASKIGLTTEALSRLGFAASRENIDFGALEIGLQRMTRRIGAAVNGSKELQGVFEQLGLDVRALADLSPDEAFSRIADATRAIGNEKQQLALFFKIFDTEGVNLIRLARQGSEGIKALGDEAQRLGRVFGEGFTQNAGRFKDTLTDLDARLTGTKINAFTPVLEELVEFLDNVGLGDRVKGLSTELLLLEERLKKPIVFDRTGVERRADQIRRELILIERRSALEAEAGERAQEAARRQSEINQTYARDVEQIGDAYDRRLSGLRTALERESAELEKARADQLAIEKEFAGLVAEITQPQVKPEDVGLGDVFLKQRQAAAAAERGEADEAIRLAREGGDLLGLLKEKGSETQGTLSFLAKQLESVAKAAAGTRVSAELVDVDQAKASFAAIQQQADILTQTAPKAGSAYAKAFLDAMRAEIEATPLPAPQIAPVSARAVALPISDNSSGQALLNRLVDTQGAK